MMLYLALLCLFSLLVIVFLDWWAILGSNVIFFLSIHRVGAGGASYMHMQVKRRPRCLPLIPLEHCLGPARTKPT